MITMTYQKQKGAVLFIALVMLLVLTLLAINSMRGVTLETRITANRAQETKFINVADAALREAEFRYYGPGNIPDKLEPKAANCSTDNTLNVNGINKLAGESFHLLYSRVHGIRATALRLTNTIGPRMRIKDARQTFVGVWIRRLLQDEPIEVWGGEQLRDFTYVDDAVDAFLLAAITPKAEGQVFNLGGPPPITLENLAALLVTIAGGGCYVVRAFPADRKKIDIGDYYANDRSIRRTLGWKPRTDLRTALARTVAYYRRELKHYV